MWKQVEQALYESMQRVITKIATLLPGILAFFLAAVLFALIGWALAVMVRKLLIAVHIDERVGKLGGNPIYDLQSSTSLSLVISRSLFWITFIAGLLIGIAAFQASSASESSTYLLSYVPRIIAAGLLLFVGTIIARFLSRSVLISAVNMNLHYARLLSVGVKWLVFVLTIAMVLDHLAIAGMIVELGFGILFGGIVLALALAIGLGSRDLVSRSLEQQAAKAPLEVEEHLRHF